ncbi:MAG: leucine-rich repeat protein [Bacteroidaceae bacterium]|nr:leucine-rich repeat protein [Bacteroidaceae bacterium]
MKKRLLLLLCLIVTAGSASALRVLKSGTFPNGAGGWQINVEDNGDRWLYIDAEVIPDYKTKEYSSGGWWTSDLTTAPWRNYTLDEEFTLKLSPRVKTIGEYAFAGTHVKSVVFQPRTEPVTIKKGAFFLTELKTFDFSYVKYIGEEAFAFCHDLYSGDFPMLEKCEADAFYRCEALAKHREIVLGKHVSLSNLTGFIDLCKKCHDGIEETVWKKAWIDESHYVPYYNWEYVVPKGSKMTFVWPVEGYGTKPDTFEGYSIENKTGGSGWSLSTTTGEFHLKRTVTASPVYETPEARPWHNLRTHIKTVRLSRSPEKNDFYGCTNLEKVVTLSDMKNVQYTGVSNGKHYYTFPISEKAFYGCTKLSAFLSYDATMYPIVPGEIVEEAFSGCEELYDIDISHSPKISKKAFYGSKVKTLRFSEIKTIGDYAFANIDIKSITMTCSAPSTSTNAFQGVTASNVTLHVPAIYGHTYEKAPWNAFELDKSLAFDKDGLIKGEIYNTLKWELTSNGILRLSGSSAIPDYDDATQQPWYNYRDFIEDIIIDDNIPSIGKNAFAIPDGEESRVLTVAIPRGLKNIGEGAFRNLNKLKNIYISNVETLGSYAFAGCSSLETIELGMKLASVGDYVFKDCHSLNEIVNMTSTPATTTNYSFAGIKSGAYNLKGGPRKANDGGQSTIDLTVTTADITKYITDPNWGKFHIPYTDDRGTWTKAGKFGDGMWILYDDGTMVIAADKGPDVDATAIELGFRGYGTIQSTDPLALTKKIEFSGNMTEFGSYFKEFINLESVELCPAIRKIPENAFYYGTEGCTKLKEINLENVDTIGNNAFSGNAFETIDLTNVKELGRYAFDNCPQLTTVKLGPVCNVGRYAFAHCPKLTTINLGSANVDNASYCFTGCSALKEITFNGTNLPLDFFYNCKSLETVNLGSRLESIEWSAFDGCTKLNTIYIDRATPPALPKGEKQVWLGDVDYRFEDAWAFDGLTLRNINLIVPEEYVSAYRAANVWKEMTINGEAGNVNSALPTGGLLGNGTWFLDTDGTFIVDVSGDIPEFDPVGKPWCETFNAWVGLIKNVIFTDNVTSIPDNFFGGTYFADASAGVETVTLGRFLKSVGANSLSFSGIKDVYVYSENLLEMESNAFDLDAAAKNNATLHILKTSDGYYYAANPATTRFHIAADLDANKMIKCGTLGTQGYWTFADGVLTVTYNGAMPTLTSKTDHADDPDVAFRYKWTSFLSEINEVVVTGKDVEVQPYFLYYEGDGPSGSHPDDHIKTVTLSDGVKRIGRGSFSLYELKRVNCYGVNAPILPATISSNYTAFWGSRITANLAFLWTVPNASTDYAQINSEWAKFNHSATKLNLYEMPTQENSVDFESGKLNQVPFFSDSQYPWDITNEDAESGRYSMKSGNKGISSSTSTISAMYLYETDGIIYFMAKCMGEGSGDGWDKCLFFIDGEQQFSYGALGNYWSNYSFPVSAGMHTFTWQYSKDSSVDPEGDGFFVDNIYFLQEGKDDDLITGVESIEDIEHSPLNIDHSWFDLSGRKLGGKPAAPGIYIMNGKKVMVK